MRCAGVVTCASSHGVAATVCAPYCPNLFTSEKGLSLHIAKVHFKRNSNALEAEGMQAQRKEMRERELDILRTIIGTVSEMFNPFDGENKVHGERAAAEFKAEMEKKGLKRDSMRIIISIEFE